MEIFLPPDEEKTKRWKEDNKEIEYHLDLELRKKKKKGLSTLTMRILGMTSSPCFCILRSISFSKARTWSSI